MAKINDFKVKDENFSGLDIMSLPTRPSASGMSAAQLQERFDAGAKQVIAPKLNQLIDLLNSTEGAGNIGITPIEGVAGYTVQQFLMAIKLLLDDKKNTEQSDREIAQKFDTSEAQALVKEVTFSEGSGVFTITKYDGSVQTYDTALEKVALDVRLDGQQFVLTLADGSEQRVDLSAFITQTEVKSSDTITLAIENGAIVARITSGSVMLSHLNAEVTAYIDEKEAAAANSAAAAKLSEQNALNSANTAKASEQAAKACQEQACSCATQAGLSRDAAKASEQAAKEAADRAVEAAGGDFVTNTAFNQFKETVPTLDDGKVSVQQGGLYINSETTEEDKAEAQEALKEIGLATAIQSLIEQGVIEVGEKAYTPSNNLVATVSSNEYFVKSEANKNNCYIGKWIPDKSGAVKIEANLKVSSQNNYMFFHVIIPNENIESYKMQEIQKLNALSVGAKFAWMSNVIDYTWGNATICSSLGNVSDSDYYVITTNYTKHYLMVNVEKGVPLYFILSSGTGAFIYCNSIKIYADEV